MWDGLIGYLHPACRAMLGASRQTLKGWVTNEKDLLEESHREIAGIVLRGLRTLSMALKWYRDAKTRVLWRPASRLGYTEVAETTLVGKKRDTCDE